MRKLILVLYFFVFGFAVESIAQELTATKPDSLIVVNPPVMDSAFYNKNILGLIAESGPSGARVIISQSRSMADAVNTNIEAAAVKKLTGFRVRIFFDNKQNARARSQEVMNGFLSRYSSVRAYWSHESPFFKVTVGDFRTKSEAMKLLSEISAEYPAAFVVRESINFPPL